MNLIEQLGLEKCQQIVDGAPDWAVNFCFSSEIDGAPYTDETEGSCDFCIYLDQLRTAIADHTDNLSHFDHCSDIANHISPLTKVTER